MSERKQKRIVDVKVEQGDRKAYYLEQYYNARDRFRGVRGPVVETDFGPKMTWEIKPNREEGLFLMLENVFDMIYDLHERLDKIQKSETKIEL